MRRLPALLAFAVVLRMAFHAVYLPAFEGPDEPYHLARAMAFASGPLRQALSGAKVGPAIVETVRGKPCCLSLHRAFGCPLFGATPARFNVLEPPTPSPPALPLGNTEDNQPPLSYVLVGLALRLWPGTPSIGGALLFFRFFGVVCVAAALFGPLRGLARGRPAGLAVGFLLLLLTPGACEALARASNDGAVFLWAAAIVWALDRRAGVAVTLALLAAGPLLKLTAFPVVAFALVALAQQGRRRLAAAGAAASLSVFPVQALRGWRWGGTLEFNQAAAALTGSARETFVGLARTVYTFLKTTFWLGEWSFFRAPRWLVVVFFLLLLSSLLLARRRGDPKRIAAHAAGAFVAMCGFFAFALANRLYYGDWGGVGGWYAWTWLPWLAVAAADLATLRAASARFLLAVLAAFVLVSNLVWFSEAWPLYG
jgi:hypothetical protein